MYSLRYGTLPIVRKVGGLADSVVNVSPKTLDSGEATGFVFDDYSANALAATIEEAIKLYAQPEEWKRVMKSGMSCDWSWTNSACHYLTTYRKALERRHDRNEDGRQ
jgi:starch synthase